METYSRTLTLERKADSPLGTIRAVLATDGEAADGHILSIRGGELAPGIPLLFGHDASSGRSNLGSWSSFTFKPHEVHGEAAIELDGAGDQRAWREDVAHMVAAGHIGSVSLRWEPIGKPIKRTALAPASPAYVDGEKETNWSKLNGYYFPKWRALEGSVVTLGADKAALVKRSLETSGAVADLWRVCAEEIEQDEGEPPSDERVEPDSDDVLEAGPVVVTPPSVEVRAATVVAFDASLAEFSAMFERLSAADAQALRDARAAVDSLWQRFVGKT